MTLLVLTLGILSGPPVERPTLQLRIHLGANRESAIVRAELKCNDDWFLEKRRAIEANYRVVLVEDLYRERPAYQIGAGELQSFRRGTFCYSGSFITSLFSIAEIDRWERDNPWMGGHPYDAEFNDWQRQKAELHFAKRPEPFPPEGEP